MLSSSLFKQYRYSKNALLFILKTLLMPLLIQNKMQAHSDSDGAALATNLNYFNSRVGLEGDEVDGVTIFGWLPRACTV